MPNEIWSKIIKYLSSEDVYQNLTLVSKRFQSLALTSGVLRIFKLDNSWVSEEKMNFLKNSTTPKKFIFWGWVVQNGDPNLEIIAKAKNLKSLLIVGLHTLSTHVAIKALKHSNSKLEHIDLDGFCGKHEDLIEISKIKTLKTFKILNDAEVIITPEIVNAFAENENQLEEIEFDYCIGKGQTEKNNKMNKALNNLLEKKSNTLRTLKFFNRDKFYDSTVPLTNLTSCKKLEEFYGGIHRNSVEILAKLPRLKKLELIRLYNPKYILDHLNLDNLKYLSILGSEYWYENEQSICQEISTHYYPNLQRLYLHNPVGLTEDFFTNMIANAPNLKSIQLLNTKCPVSFQFMSNFFKNSNIFVCFNSKSFEEFLIGNDPIVFQKYNQMKNSFNEWSSNNSEYASC